ncbi:MAG: sucrase ferredoxin [Leptolyngbya sp. Prado105]|jgi:hypothetical protein|nr:sucrase ferredoxin [Leptolyngbya sp. Prado105]
MSHAFCAMMSRESGEDLIGTAPTFSTYVLIECPHPWAEREFESKAVPSNLKAFVEHVRQAKLSIRFLLFKGEPSEQTRVMIFRKSEGLMAGYRKRQFQLDSIKQVAPLLESYWSETGLEIDTHDSPDSDIFVCTHGSHDKCCAKFGYPFYREASKLATSSNVWQVSHIGGHRFAPTIVTFPDGRYYGRLDAESFSAIINCSGEICHLERVYRGWGVLPKPVQVIERAIALERGWEWVGYQIDYQILLADSESMQIELRGEKEGERSLIYTATIGVSEIKDVIGSCGNEAAMKVVKFSIEQIQQVTQSQSWTIPRRTISQSNLAISS